MAASDLRSFGHRSRTLQMGYDREDFAGKPVIAVVNTWSEINPCHTHLRERAEDVKRGVWQAGGFPLEVPAMSLSEPFMKPSTMLYRNLLAMETEELLRSYPFDGAVLLGGCDKTTPALVMGAIQRGPAVRCSCRRGRCCGRAGAASVWARARTSGSTGPSCAPGRSPKPSWEEIEDGIASSPGHCMTMGTASTMTSAVEALGVTLPGAASIPAADSDHPRMAVARGGAIVSMVRASGRRLTRESFENAIKVVLALGGSTNAVIHLIAMAGRAGVPLSLDRFDALSRAVPVLANIRPSGKYLMQDFFEAGGLRALMSDSRVCTTSRRTVAGHARRRSTARRSSTTTSSGRCDESAAAEGGLAVLRGSLAPDGCVIKHSAAVPRAAPAHAAERSCSRTTPT